MAINAMALTAVIGDCKGVGPFAGVWGGAPRKKKGDGFLPSERHKESPESPTTKRKAGNQTLKLKD